MSNIKQVVVIAKYLHMRQGKAAAQAAHASLSVFLQGLSDKPHTGNRKSATFEIELTTDMQTWLEEGQTKICVYVNSEQELLDVYQQAKAAGIISALIKDAGHTEFKGVATLTCCAIGPASAEEIDKITGKLPLL